MWARGGVASRPVLYPWRVDTTPSRGPAARRVTLTDVRRDPREVVGGLATWQRGDHAEAIADALAACGRELHARQYTLWVWTTVNDGNDPVWLLPVPAQAAAAFAPRGPAAVLVRCLAAAAELNAVAEGIRLLDWHGQVGLELPGADDDHELAMIALHDHHPDALVVEVMPLDASTLGQPEALITEPVATRDGALADAAHTLRVHPVEVVNALLEHGQPLDIPVGPEMLAQLRAWGVSGEPPPAPTPGPPRMGVLEDPCPRRRHARRVLQRMFRMRKIGANYHTAWDHTYRGAPADQRSDALAVGEALLKAGLLGEKPSMGQRHVYLRREALPAIHALIDRGETHDPELAAMWTAPAPGTMT